MLLTDVLFCSLCVPSARRVFAVLVTGLYGQALNWLKSYRYLDITVESASLLQV